MKQVKTDELLWRLVSGTNVALQKNKFKKGTQLETHHPTEYALLRAKPKTNDNVDGLAGPLAGWAAWAGGACWAWVVWALWAVWAVDQHTIETIGNETS